MLVCFLIPTIVAALVYIVVSCIPIDKSIFGDINERIGYVLVCVLKTMMWAIPYIAILYFGKIVDFKQIKK